MTQNVVNIVLKCHESGLACSDAKYTYGLLMLNSMAQTVTVVYFGYSNVYYQLYSAQVEWSGFQNKNEMNNILQLYYYIFFSKITEVYTFEIKKILRNSLLQKCLFHV